MERQLLIIGSGPAGLTAAIYAARANLNPLLITGYVVGGQISLTYEVENYPGFPETLTGPQLVELMQKQAERFGTEMAFEQVTAVDLNTEPFTIKTDAKEYQARAVIIATGATPRALEVPGEKEFTGKGVSYCATCDGFFFREKDVVVVGGGDSAVEEGLFLTRFANKVRIIHRRDELRADPILQQRAFNNPKIEFIWDTLVRKISGDGTVQAVETENVKNGKAATLATEGVFVYIGHTPNTQLFVDQLKMDEMGYLVTDQRMHTNIPGVFAAGEVSDHIFRQIVTSAGFGCMAAMEAEKYLASLGDRKA
ncbi:MAG: thioredoxin-disulfide reductase [Chloroflexi bacterium]|nr:thioredoxin-disulfide reductase [Chloroflexota bacterium]